MIKIHVFTFNDFQENTYVLYDDTKECVIIDPGCYTNSEQSELSKFVTENELKPIKLLNTHCHIDHVLGNQFVAQKFKVGLEIHRHDLLPLKATVKYGQVYGFNVEPSPEPVNFLEEKDEVEFGSSRLEVIYAPGHSPGHVVFISHEHKFIIGGDVLFRESIGRTDLPGGDYQTLIDSIKNKLMKLDDSYTVYSGHGPSTTIGHERKYNPFINQ